MITLGHDTIFFKIVFEIENEKLKQNETQI